MSHTRRDTRTMAPIPTPIPIPAFVPVLRVEGVLFAVLAVAPGLISEELLLDVAVAEVSVIDDEDEDGVGEDNGVEDDSDEDTVDDRNADGGPVETVPATAAELLIAPRANEVNTSGAGAAKVSFVGFEH